MGDPAATPPPGTGTPADGTAPVPDRRVAVGGTGSTASDRTPADGAGSATSDRTAADLTVPDVTSSGGEHVANPRAVVAVVTGVVVVGAAAVAAVALAARGLPPPSDAPADAPWWLVAVFVGLAVCSELFYVPLRHGDTTEELAFLEVAVVAAVLVLPPVPALLVPLIGSLLVSVVLRRPLSKTLFNLGSYGAATAVLVATYLLIAHGEPRFSAWSVAGLLLGTLLFAAVNLTALTEVLHAVEGLRRREVWHDEWMLSAGMAVGGVAVGATAVALATYTPVLVPFAALPAMALWYAYSAAAQHALERERNVCLVDFGLALANPEGTSEGEGFQAAVDAVRRVAGADEAVLVLPPHHPDLCAAANVRHGAIPVPSTLLPAGWSGATAYGLDLGPDSVGALVLGTTATWRPREDDEPVVVALATALAGALRAGHARQEKESETDTLRAVIEHSTDGIAVVGADGVVRLWSPALVRMTGVDATGLAAADLPEQASALVEVAYDGSPAAYRPAPRTVTISLGEDDTRDLTVSAARVSEAAAGPGQRPVTTVTVLTVHDETATRRADRLKADFVATISHELRTPITPIKGYAQLLARRGDRMDPRRRAEALELIAERADHLTRLVDDLLLVSRVSGPTKLTVHPEDEDLRELVERTVAAFPRLADRLEVRLPDAPVPVRCDAQRATQCLSNLLANAEKYTPVDTAVEVTLDAPRYGDRMAVVTVRDHGAGIPEDLQERVFERFYRIEDPFTMRTGGSGLGLHIARELAVAMGGGLTLRSEPGDGCTFALALPLAPEAQSGPSAATHRMEAR